MTFDQYIGMPWVVGTCGPDTFDCMGFFKHVQEKHFNVKVPMIFAPDPTDEKAITMLFLTHEERKNWAKIDQPVHGCAVLIRRPMHIGTWLNVDGGGVLHCVRGVGVVFTADCAWAVSGFGRREFFRYAA
jgi:hypothetical protein